jgi:predicted nucleic acid-binding Zn ribbon protein
MKCSFCGGAVSWVGNLIDNPSTQCAGCGQRNCQEVEPIAHDEDEEGADASSSETGQQENGNG